MGIGSAFGDVIEGGGQEIQRGNDRVTHTGSEIGKTATARYLGAMNNAPDFAGILNEQGYGKAIGAANDLQDRAYTMARNRGDNGMSRDMGALYAQAMGNGPSVAALQGQAGMQQAQMAGMQYGAARQPGASALGALSTTLQGQGLSMGQAAQQAAMARGGETAQSLAAYGQAGDQYARNRAAENQSLQGAVLQGAGLQANLAAGQATSAQNASLAGQNYLNSMSAAGLGGVANAQDSRRFDEQIGSRVLDSAATGIGTYLAGMKGDK